ncbi:hypothetical protein GCM10011344_24380 [Dokdonia pacifica]|uniref:Uncharacterized protein n=1 Tax=Dokdonia pacifica TaxID=1627892 RepID=A0A238WPC4_9FLAO|nr:hypothetical protein [Dokdonia pacifica]GGG22723.1 hypothetical protein GCM10011344_24380 [Dokdonia pacifica]SNR48104.1 hypothetical protein SAMN06265376_1011269 [Dokdonia pacifica]
MKEYMDLTIKEFLRILSYSLIALVSVSLLVFLLFINTMGNHFVEKEFSSSIWKADQESRIEMIDDLVSKKIIDDLPVWQMITLLGMPDEDCYFYQPDHDMIYYLGPERGYFSIDSEFLLIWLNDDNFVEKYEIVLD